MFPKIPWTVSINQNQNTQGLTTKDHSIFKLIHRKIRFLTWGTGLTLDLKWSPGRLKRKRRCNGNLKKKGIMAAVTVRALFVVFIQNNGLTLASIHMDPLLTLISFNWIEITLFLLLQRGPYFPTALKTANDFTRGTNLFPDQSEWKISNNVVRLADCFTI